MTDTTLITLAFVSAYAITLVAIGALAYRSETAQRVSDWLDTWT